MSVKTIPMASDIFLWFSVKAMFVFSMELQFFRFVMGFIKKLLFITSLNSIEFKSFSLIKILVRLCLIR